MSSSDNLTYGEYPQLNWEDTEKTFDNLERLQEYAVLQANQAIDWYIRKKGPKKRLGYGLRFSAIAFTFLSGIIPILATIDHWQDFLAPVYATFALAIAAALIAIDRFGGYTSGWIRYMLTCQQIMRELKAFQFDWEAMKVGFTKEPIGEEEIRTTIDFFKKFAISVDGTIEEETKSWASDFQSALREIEKRASAKPRS